MDFLIDFILHLDHHLANIVREYGTLTYIILFLIVFTETGLIVMPFLPGDSLLFTAGTLAALPETGLKVWYIIPLLILAALLGDNVNYFFGKFFSDYIRKRERILFFKREYLDQTEAFYAKHGAKTIIMARFVPIVRTIAPFVAGAGKMKYRNYIINCVLGAVLWVFSLTFLGYLFGNIPIVKENFDKVVLLIVGISVLPMIITFIKSKKK